MDSTFLEVYASIMRAEQLARPLGSRYSFNRCPPGEDAESGCSIRSNNSRFAKRTTHRLMAIVAAFVFLQV